MNYEALFQHFETQRQSRNRILRYSQIPEDVTRQAALAARTQRRNGREAMFTAGRRVLDVAERHALNGGAGVLH
jgi:hypothetical protein